MTKDSKDAFLQPPLKVTEEGEAIPEVKRECKPWGRRLIVDGVEVDPETMEPLTKTED